MQGQELNSVLETEVKGKCKVKRVKSKVEGVKNKEERVK